MNFMKINLAIGLVAQMAIGSPALSTEYTYVKPHYAFTERKMNFAREGGQFSTDTGRSYGQTEFTTILKTKKFNSNKSQFEIIRKSAVEGNSNGGGGNSLEGKLIESYIKDPMFEIPAYNNVVRPIIELLATKSPCLATVYQMNINNLAWYFIPARLKELSESVTGIPFLSDQIAVPIMMHNEIWIDSDLFDSLDSDYERGKLIIHEAILKSASVYPHFKIQPPPAQSTSLARRTTVLLFSSQLQEMTSEQFYLSYKSLGWGDTYETLMNPNCNTK